MKRHKETMVKLFSFKFNKKLGLKNKIKGKISQSYEI